jgi:hypothetical protein
MDADKYVAYFEDLATNLKDIGHTPDKKKFSRIDIEEVLTSMRTSLDMTTMCLVLEMLEGQLNDNISDNIMNMQAGAFLLLRHVKKGDYAAENVAMADAFKIFVKLLSKIKKDRETFPMNDANRSNGLVKYFDFSSVKYNKVGPIFDNCYGLRIEFGFSESVSFAFNPNDWLYV